jgi:hypothetical protein
MLSRILSELSKTHAHIIGSTGAGKSKLIEAILGEALKQGKSFCLIDWHGTLYRDILKMLSVLRPKRNIYLLNPNESEHITGFNPFVRPDSEPSAAVSRLIDATVKPWGATSTDDTPQLAQVLRLVFTYAVERGETLPNVSHLLDASRQGLRKAAASQIKDAYMRRQWEEFAGVSDTKFRDLVASSVRRLDRFLAPVGVRRMLGLKEGNLNLREIVEAGGILLVNLSASDYLPPESAKLLAALLLAEFLEIGLSHAKNPVKYVLALDEFQEYITHDVASMLDQVRKGGLHLLLAHHRLAQLARDEELNDAIATQARLKIVFGGLRYEAASDIALEISLSDINKRKIKDVFEHQVTQHELISIASETRTQSETFSAEDDELRMTTGRSDLSSWMLLPIYGREVSSITDYTLDERTNFATEQLMNLKQRQCFLKFPSESAALRWTVPSVREYRVYDSKLRDYEVAIYEKQGARSSEDVDRMMEEDAQRFLNATIPARKKKPSTPPPSGPPRI